MLGIRALFNWFARPRGPRPVPIKIDPAWFPVPQPEETAEVSEWTPPWVATQQSLPPWNPPWLEVSSQETDDPDDFDPAAFAEDNPDWDEEPPEPEPDEIFVHPGDRVPDDAGELLRSFYAVGIGDVRVYARLHPDEMDLSPDQIVEPGDLKRDFNMHFGRKGPKPRE